MTEERIKDPRKSQRGWLARWHENTALAFFLKILEILSVIAAVIALTVTISEYRENRVLRQATLDEFKEGKSLRQATFQAMVMERLDVARQKDFKEKNIRKRAVQRENTGQFFCTTKGDQFSANEGQVSLMEKLVKLGDNITGFSASNVNFVVQQSTKNFVVEYNKSLKGYDGEKFHGMVLDNAKLTQADFTNTNLRKASFKRAELTYTKFVYACLEGARFDNASLNYAEFSNSDLRFAWFTNANLIGAHLHQANLGSASIRNANLTDALLPEANLSHANIENAILKNAKIGFAGLTGANLSGANLSGASLIGADLSYANLTGANFTGASLARANLTGANISGAILHNVRGGTEEEEGLTQAQLDSACADANNRPKIKIRKGRRPLKWEDQECD